MRRAGLAATQHDRIAVEAVADVFHETRHSKSTVAVLVQYEYET